MSKGQHLLWEMPLYAWRHCFHLFFFFRHVPENLLSGLSMFVCAFAVLIIYASRRKYDVLRCVIFRVKLETQQANLPLAYFSKSTLRPREWVLSGKEGQQEEWEGCFYITDSLQLSPCFSWAPTVVTSPSCCDWYIPKRNLKEKWCIWVHSFRVFSPWLPDPMCLGRASSGQEQRGHAGKLLALWAQSRVWDRRCGVVRNRAANASKPHLLKFP